MEEIPSWEANGSTASQAFPWILGNQKFQCRFLQSPSLMRYVSRKKMLKVVKWEAMSLKKMLTESVWHRYN
jgi:hypothetical protein